MEYMEYVDGLRTMLEIALIKIYCDCTPDYLMKKYKDYYIEFCKRQGIKPDDYFVKL